MGRIANIILSIISRYDIIKVVRCKSCKYNTGEHKCLYPDSIIAIPKDDDFCSYGEKNRELKNEMKNYEKL